MTNTVKSQVRDFIRQGQSLVDIINYLLTCDYSVLRIMNTLVDEFGCQETLVLDTFRDDFDIEIYLS